ncbi:hypothetical protein P5673_028660, partial [Acropora cervicornis]
RLNSTRKTALSDEIIITGVRFTHTSIPAELDHVGNLQCKLQHLDIQLRPRQFFTHMDVISTRIDGKFEQA